MPSGLYTTVPTSSVCPLRVRLKFPELKEWMRISPLLEADAISLPPGEQATCHKRLLTEDDSVLKCDEAAHTRMLPSSEPDAYRWPSEEQAAVQSTDS